MKKSQVAIFFVVAILILAVALFLFIRRPIAEEERKELVSFRQTKEVFEQYVKDCVIATTDKAINRYGLEYMDVQVEYYIEKHLPECLDNFQEFRNMGYDVVFSDHKIYINIYGKNVDTSLNVKAELTSETDKAKFEIFQTHIEYPEDFKDPNLGFEWKFRGIMYKYEETDNPRPMHIHVVKADLEDPTLSYYVTPRIAPNVMVTSQFLVDNGLQLAINGGGFDIGGTNEVNVYSVYKGIAYSAENITPGESVFVTRDNEVSVGDNVPEGLYYAVTGFNHMVNNGAIPEKFIDPNHPSYKVGYDTIRPRTSVGKDEKNNWLNIIVLEGDNPKITNGSTIKDLGNLHLKYGSTNAVNMDGGGSTTLVIQEDGGYKNLYSAEDRPVANHFGIYAQPFIRK